mgnify:CR=1 FL=1
MLHAPHDELENNIFFWISFVICFIFQTGSHMTKTFFYETRIINLDKMAGNNDKKKQSDSLIDSLKS